MTESVLISDEDRVLLVKVSCLLEELVETFNILEDKETMARLKEAEEDVKAGRVRDYNDFFKELKETGEI
jgi:PHD/YefM family antitoxin component YafN of YafNO toxin-antitoxin module